MGPDPSVLSHVLEGHGDAVWGLAFSPASQRLASCSADGTVRIWDPSSSSPTCLCTFPTVSGEWGDSGGPGTSLRSCAELGPPEKVIPAPQPWAQTGL